MRLGGPRVSRPANHSLQSPEYPITITDDDLVGFEADGAQPFPQSVREGHVAHDGARIWYAAFGFGPPVVLLHGGLGNSGNWGYQIPALLANGFQAVVIDSRGHGRSTTDGRPYSYARMASDVRAVLDELVVRRAAIVGWSDGATIGCFLAMDSPERVAGLFFFGSNLDMSGVKDPFDASPVVDRCFSRHARDYKALSSTPDDFGPFVQAVSQMMQSEPNLASGELATISVPVAIAYSEHDQFIHRSHAEYLARTIPNAQWVFLRDVSHFAPVQRPDVFNDAMLSFLKQVSLPTR
jgi:pimeloyl-ACP methyl ester carboxylesterase